MMRQQLILHIPHSSTHIPFRDGYIVDDAILEKEILELTDWYTDELFFSEKDITIKADFSRIFCDVERFSDDSREIMSKYGMGVLYEKSDDGLLIRKKDPDMRKRIMDQFYWKHHNALQKTVEEQLIKNGKTLIIDCHSFPGYPHQRDPDQNPERPDINIGTDPFHTPKDLTDITTEYFRSKDFSVEIDHELY